MNVMKELSYDQLRVVCPESMFEYPSTKEIPELTEIIGQERTIEVITFGIEIDSDGFNIFAIGPSGAGKTTIIQQFVFEKARGKHIPNDWCYVYNFDEEYKPRCLRLPTGKGSEFRMDMQLLIE
jgi:hypothetical protein